MKLFPYGEQFESFYNGKNKHKLSWLDRACEPLAQTVGFVESLFDPQCIILGGVLTDVLIDHFVAHFIDQVQLLTGLVSNRLDRKALRLVRGASRRMTATLGGAAIIINNVFAPRIESAIVSVKAQNFSN